MTARNLALEALYAGQEARTFSERLKAHALGRAAIAALEAETGEPVAWRKNHKGVVDVRHTYTDNPRAVAMWAELGVTLEPLYTAPPSAVTPGWKLVPIEPTPEMWKAGLAHLFRDVDAVWKAMLAEVPDATVSTVSQWIPVTERMPVGGCKVFVFYRNSYGLGRRTCAHYAPLHTIDASHWEDGEPDETEDGVFEPKGWWEELVEAGQVTFISDEVTHWMPLPEAPK